jgi:plastocyanin
MKAFFSVPCLLASLLAAAVVTPQSAMAQDHGDFTGQIVFDGDVPTVEIKIKKGDPTAKDAAVCAAQDVISEELVVNPENKGIQHIFVFLKSKVKKGDIPAELAKSKEAEVVFDQKGCQFIPHSLIVRTDQQVIVKSADNVAHNTHTYSIFNPSQNFIVGANDRDGIKMPKFSLKERLPFEVKCDIHPWMSARWLVVDHPYAAITDKDGKFTIKGLPAGDHEFTLWHEKVGYVEKELEVKINGGKTTDLKTVKVAADRFK